MIKKLKAKLKERRDRRAFKKFCDEKDAERFQEFQAAVLSAKARTRTESGKRFVRSCARYLKKNHWLTEKQLDALANIDHDRYYPDDDEIDWPGFPFDAGDL